MTALVCRLFGHDFPEYTPSLNGVATALLTASYFGPCSRCGATRQATREEILERLASVSTSLEGARESLRRYITLQADSLRVIRAAENLGEAPKGTRRSRAAELAKAVADFHEARPERLIERQAEIAGRDLAEGLRAGLESGLPSQPSATAGAGSRMASVVVAEHPARRRLGSLTGPLPVGDPSRRRSTSGVRPRGPAPEEEATTSVAAKSRARTRRKGPVA